MAFGEKLFGAPVNKYRPERSLITGMGAGAVQDLIDFPQQLSGLTILDILTGTCNNVADLRRKGANIIGVDLAYRDLKGFKERFVQGIVDPYWWRTGRRPAQFSAGEIDNWLRPNDDDPIHIRLSKLAYHDLMQDMENGGGYIAAQAEKLPFADNSVDMVYSTYGLSSILIADYDAFRAAVLEIVRVLKSGGKLQLVPWIHFDDVELWTRKQTKNMKEFIEFLSNSDLTFALEESGGHRKINRLTVIKPM